MINEKQIEDAIEILKKASKTNVHTPEIVSTGGSCVLCGTEASSLDLMIVNPEGIGVCERCIYLSLPIFRQEHRKQLMIANETRT